MSITEDVEEFIRLHRKHGPLVGGAAEPTLIGHRVTIACPLRRDVRAPCDGRRGDGRPGEAGAAESTMLDQRRRNLVAPLAFAQLTSAEPELRLLHTGSTRGRASARSQARWRGRATSCR